MTLRSMGSFPTAVFVGTLVTWILYLAVFASFFALGTLGTDAKGVFASMEPTIASLVASRPQSLSDDQYAQVISSQNILLGTITRAGLSVLIVMVALFFLSSILRAYESVFLWNVPCTHGHFTRFIKAKAVLLGVSLGVVVLFSFIAKWQLIGVVLPCLFLLFAYANSLLHYALSCTSHDVFKQPWRLGWRFYFLHGISFVFAALALLIVFVLAFQFTSSGEWTRAGILLGVAAAITTGGRCALIKTGVFT